MTATPERGLSRRRKLLFGCCAALLCAALLIGGLEVLLRYVTPSLLGQVAETQGMVQEAPGGTVTPVPGFRGQMTVNGEACGIRINRAGLRGPEVPERTAATRRVLVLGDSMTFGSGVEDDRTFCAALDAMLDRDDRTVDVLNGGVPAYGVRESALRLGRLAPDLAPDAIVMCVYIGNDFEDDVLVDRVVLDGFMLTRSTAQTIESSWRGRLALRSRVWLLGERLLESMVPRASLMAAIQAADRPNAAERTAFADWPPVAQRRECLFMDAEPPGKVQREAFDRLEAALSAVRRAAAGRPLLVAILPTYRHCIAGAYRLSLQELALDPAAHRQGNTQRAVARAAAAADLPCFDLTGPLSAAANPIALFIPGDFHLTPAGHRAVAEALAPEIEALFGR